MSDRKSLISTLWLTSSLALLASVLVAPIRTSGFVTTSPRPDCLSRYLALPLDQPTASLNSATTTDAIPEVEALASEIEEQDWAGAPEEPRIAFLIYCSFRKTSERRLIVPLSTLSLYPLRC